MSIVFVIIYDNFLLYILKRKFNIFFRIEFEMFKTNMKLPYTKIIFEEFYEHMFELFNLCAIIVIVLIVKY